MKLSRNKIDKIFKIRKQSKKKYKKRKNTKGGMVRRSFRENKLNLKKRTLRLKMKVQQGGLNDKIITGLSEAIGKKDPKEILQFARTAVTTKQSTHDKACTFDSLLYVQLLIANWQKIEETSEHWIIPWSNENGSPLVQLFGKRTDPKTLVNLTVKAEERKKRINGDGTKQFEMWEQSEGWKEYIYKPDGSAAASCFCKMSFPGRITKVYWSYLHDIACQILGYCVIPAKVITEKREKKGKEWKTKKGKENLKHWAPRKYSNNDIVPGKHEKSTKEFTSMEDLKNLFAILVSQEAEKKMTNETKEEENANMAASDFYDDIANWIYKTWEVDYGAGARQLGDTLSVEERKPRINYYKLSSTLNLWTISMATNKAVRLACSTPPSNLPPLPNGSDAANEVAKYTKMKEETATVLEAQIEEMNKQVNDMNRYFLASNYPYQGCFNIIIGTSTQIFNSMRSCVSVSSGNGQDWTRLGGVIDVVYQTIINKWVTAPTDATLKWWWQKETLLSIPSSVPISNDLKGKLGKVPKKVISQAEVNEIPEIVRDLILRRVNGILLRTNLLPKGNEEEEKKENMRERFTIERKRLLQEHYLNYTRSIIVRGYLIDKLKNDAVVGGCGGTNFNIVLSRFEERKVVLYEKYQELLLQRGKTKEDIEKRSELIKAFAERKILEKDIKDSKGTKFESSTQSSFIFNDKTKKYTKINTTQWASNIILSIHQLMLESWTYPLKSEEKGDIEYFVDKNKIFEIDAMDKKIKEKDEEDKKNLKS